MYLPEKKKIEPSTKIVASEDHDMLEPEEPRTMTVSRKRKLDLVKEVIQ